MQTVIALRSTCCALAFTVSLCILADAHAGQGRRSSTAKMKSELNTLLHRLEKNGIRIVKVSETEIQIVSDAAICHVPTHPNLLANADALTRSFDALKLMNEKGSAIQITQVEAEGNCLDKR